MVLLLSIPACVVTTVFLSSRVYCGGEQPSHSDSVRLLMSCEGPPPLRIQDLSATATNAFSR